SRSVRNDIGYKRSRGCFRSESRRQLRRQFLEVESKAGASHGAFIFQLRHDLADHIDWHGETDALIAATPGKDRSVDADQLAPCVDQSAAGVAGIDRSIGLNEVLIVFNAQTAATCRTDDSHGHGLSESERISHGQCNISDLNIGRRAERYMRQ